MGFLGWLAGFWFLLYIWFFLVRVVDVSFCLMFGFCFWFWLVGACFCGFLQFFGCFLFLYVGFWCYSDSEPECLLRLNI